MIKGSLVLTFMLLNSLSAQEYLGAEDLASRHELEMQFLKESFKPAETPVVVSEAPNLEEGEEDIADEVNTQAAAPVAATIKPAVAEDDEDFVLPLEQEMFGTKEEKPSRTKKAAKNTESNHKRRLR